MYNFGVPIYDMHARTSSFGWVWRFTIPVATAYCCCSCLCEWMFSLRKWCFLLYSSPKKCAWNIGPIECNKMWNKNEMEMPPSEYGTRVPDTFHAQRNANAATGTIWRCFFFRFLRSELNVEWREFDAPLGRCLLPMSCQPYALHFLVYFTAQNDMKLVFMTKVAQIDEHIQFSLTKWKKEKKSFRRWWHQMSRCVTTGRHMLSNYCQPMKGQSFLILFGFSIRIELFSMFLFRKKEKSDSGNRIYLFLCGWKLGKLTHTHSTRTKYIFGIHASQYVNMELD